MTRCDIRDLKECGSECRDGCKAMYIEPFHDIGQQAVIGMFPPWDLIQLIGAIVIILGATYGAVVWLL